MISLENTTLLCVISAPSGAGKTTLCERLLAEFDQLNYSVSCTTRPPRPGEENGKDYYFISETEFHERIQQGDFLEYASVHGYQYGTLKSQVLQGIETGKDVLMDLDVQGAFRLRRTLHANQEDALLKQSYADIFIAPPSIETLEKRLRSRGKDPKDVIGRRLDRAEKECARWSEYRYLIVNDDLETSYNILRSILIAEHHRVRKS
ncbi:MAG: guanylate kinase [Kiritimatiellae bacterium]|nr:guanylate kinase [Kiritimatiellia bacterium]